MRKKDCFAFRTNGKVDECDALNTIRCTGCPFYKPAETVEYFEKKTTNGQIIHGYNNKDNGQLAKLILLRAKIDEQINAITG